MNYSPLTQNVGVYNNYCSLRPKRLQFSNNYASLHRATHGPRDVIMDSKSECESDTPLLASSYHQHALLSSEVSSSDLNHSLATSDDTSEVSSERDRESEV